MLRDACALLHVADETQIIPALSHVLRIAVTVIGHMQTDRCADRQMSRQTDRQNGGMFASRETDTTYAQVPQLQRLSTILRAAYAFAYEQAGAETDEADETDAEIAAEIARGGRSADEAVESARDLADEIAGERGANEIARNLAREIAGGRSANEFAAASAAAALPAGLPSIGELEPLIRQWAIDLRSSRARARRLERRRASFEDLL